MFFAAYIPEEARVRRGCNAALHCSYWMLLNPLAPERQKTPTHARAHTHTHMHEHTRL